MSQISADMVTHNEIIANGVRLHYAEAGSGPLVILLHGFPEFWYSWRHQIPALASAGYHIVAPDMRGYNLSEKPYGVKSYRIEQLVTDVVALIRAKGYEKATIIGHDWGGAVAWLTAAQHPEVVEKLVAISCPHPRSYMRHLWSLSQLKRSWYIFFFQLPWLPEFLFRARKFRTLRTLLENETVHKEVFSSEDIQKYIQAISQPGALTAAINYYRAMFRRGPLSMWKAARKVKVPALLIWGRQEKYFDFQLALKQKRYAPGIRVEVIDEASHWVQTDCPERVNQVLIDFLKV